MMAALMLPMSLIMNTASIFYIPVTQELGISLAAFGMNLTIIMLVCAFAAPTLFTPLARKFKLRYLLAAAIAIEAVCFAVRAVATNIWVFYISSLFIAFPMGLLCNICIPIVANAWFPEKPGTAIGVMASLQGLGGMLFSALGGIMITDLGWRMTFWIFAAVCLLFVPFTVILMRNEPSEVGQVAKGLEKKDDAMTAKVEARLSGISRNKALKTAAFWLLAVLLVASGFAANVWSYINPYCQSLGLSAVLAGFISATVQAGVFCNKLILGAIADKKGARVAGIFYTITGILCFSLILVGGSQFAIVAVACFLLGPLYSSCNLMGPIFTKALFGTKDQPRIWALYVMIFCTTGAIASTAWGLVAASVGYAGAFIACIAIIVLALVLVIVVMGMQKRLQSQWTEDDQQPTPEPPATN